MIFSLVRGNVLLWATIVEGSMLVGALICGWLLSFHPLATITGKTSDENLFAAGEGLAAGTALFVAGIAIANLPLPAIRRFEDFMARQVIPLFEHSSWLELAYISALAGLGEEAIFRGLLQNGIKAWLAYPTGWVWAVAVSSILFGICHALNWTYLVLATLMGLCFGLLLYLSDNLLVCIVAHGWYDFLMLLYLVRRMRGETRFPPGVGDQLPQ